MNLFERREIFTGNIYKRNKYNHQMLEIHKMQQNKKMIIKGSMIEQGVNKGKKTSLR